MKTILCFYLILFCPLPALAHEPDLSGEASSRDQFFYIYPITFFQKYISPVDGDRCPMYPSCSSYSKQAFQTHGFFMGWIMTCDRLMRCGRDETRLSPEIMQNGRRLTYDSLSQNDFWWK